MTVIVTTHLPVHGSNVGKYRARMRPGGVVRTLRADQALSSVQNHERVARKLADDMNLVIQSRQQSSNNECLFDCTHDAESAYEAGYSQGIADYLAGTVPGQPWIPGVLADENSELRLLVAALTAERDALLGNRESDGDNG